MKSKVIALVLLQISSLNSTIAAPGLDCKAATQWHEKQICEYKALAVMDSEIAAAYESLKSKLASEELDLLIKDQKAWVKETRTCGERIASLPEDQINEYDWEYANWCLENTYRWRKVRLFTALEKVTYKPYRKKSHCYNRGLQNTLQCLIEGVQPEIRQVTKLHSIKIYDYPFDGTETSMLLPGASGKTYIVDIGGQLVSASEIVGDNSCCYKEVRDSPVLIIESITQSGARIDGCADSGGGHCSIYSSYAAFRLDHPEETPLWIDRTPSFTNVMRLALIDS